VEEDFWTNQEKLFEEEANELIQPFTMSEVEATLLLDQMFACRFLQENVANH
jgi:hypothetical protein